MTLDEDAETTVDGARRENDSNGQNSHQRDGKERLLVVREKGRRDAALFRKRSCCKRGVFFLFVLVFYPSTIFFSAKRPMSHKNSFSTLLNYDACALF